MSNCDSQSAACCAGRESMAPANKRRGIAARAAVVLLRSYQRRVSPLLPPTCRFYPTCSEYALQSIARHGFLRGAWLALRRLCKCHPLHPGGYDPVH